MCFSWVVESYWRSCQVVEFNTTFGNNVGLVGGIEIMEKLCSENTYPLSGSSTLQAFEIFSRYVFPHHMYQLHIYR